MKQPLPEKMLPALDSLQSVWFKMADEEQRVESVIRDTPDPVFDGGQPDPAREEMIRVHGIVRAHRRFTRQCIDLISWGEPHEKLPHFSDKAKVESAEAAQKAAEVFEKAAEDLVSVLIGLRDEAVNGNDLSMSSAYISERLSLAIQNYRYARDSARSDLRKGLR